MFLAVCESVCLNVHPKLSALVHFESRMSASSFEIKWSNFKVVHAFDWYQNQ